MEIIERPKLVLNINKKATLNLDKKILKFKNHVKTKLQYESVEKEKIVTLKTTSFKNGNSKNNEQSTNKYEVETGFKNISSADSSQDDKIQPDVEAQKPIIKKTLKFLLSKEDYSKILGLLKQKLPKLFGEGIKLLRVGITNNLREILKDDDISNAKLRKFLHVYCGSRSYKKLLATPGNKRCDIDGNEVEEVSEEHSIYARKVLARTSLVYRKKKSKKLQTEQVGEANTIEVS